MTIDPKVIIDTANRIQDIIFGHENCNSLKIRIDNCVATMKRIETMFKLIITNVDKNIDDSIESLDLKKFSNLCSNFREINVLTSTAVVYFGGLNSSIHGLLKPLCPIQNIKKDLEAIENIYPNSIVPLITSAQKDIIFKLPQVTVTDSLKKKHTLGPFKLTITLSKDLFLSTRCPLAEGTIRILPWNGQTPKSKLSSRHYHPHIKTTGEICAGEAVASINHFVKTLQLLSLYEVLISLLSTYNKSSAFTPLETWTECTRCSTCNNVTQLVEQGKSYNCIACQALLCRFCRHACESCNETLCVKHIIKCKNCNKSTCSFCQNQGLCKQCFNKITDDTKQLSFTAIEKHHKAVKESIITYVETLKSSSL